MLKTVLLLDGSAAMNSSADYLPTRLLALRPQLVKFVHTYLDANPLASLGAVAMRDGVAHRLNVCTTNAVDIIQGLEVKYFLTGGSGAMSLENGLRMSLDELVDLKRMAKRMRKVEVNSNGNNHNHNNSNSIKGAQEECTTRLRIILISSSVTIIDPQDVFKVLKALPRLRVRVDVISFCGAVHVFEKLAESSGGILYTPMNYDHFTEVLKRLASPDKSHISHEEKPAMIPIGFPMYLEVEEGGNEGGKAAKFLVCPQCGLMQTSIPSTCPLCKLLLCSAPLIHTTFIAHNELCAPSQSGKDVGASSCCSRCSLCQDELVGEDENSSTSVWSCSACRCVRCGSCEKYIRESIGLCPTCIASPPR